MHPQTKTAALGTLLILQGVMFAALLFKLPPHPPEVIPIAGMAPTLGASLCAAFAALVMRGEGIAGKLLIIIACLLAAISYGPQKYFDPAFSLVWPAVITAQLAIVALLGALVQEKV
ncbi:hypothetical protein [Thalassobius sp. Cn5-15]|uniref:hypothetical protein n=1 Tax=Thalassobius sp. Cn5-15 TaxID=2917763 RepID=UPI001EF26914|nr:hypothetical protein [Thalassobius sp. Cn5-15]MCG7493977.1 hypothetical protein [Thalassobius sp. Cn5-15]